MELIMVCYSLLLSQIGMNVRYLIVVIQMQLAPTAKGHTNVRADSVTLEMDKIARGIEVVNCLSYHLNLISFNAISQTN